MSAYPSLRFLATTFGPDIAQVGGLMQAGLIADIRVDWISAVKPTAWRRRRG